MPFLKEVDLAGGDILRRADQGVNLRASDFGWGVSAAGRIGKCARDKGDIGGAFGYDWGCINCGLEERSASIPANTAGVMKTKGQLYTPDRAPTATTPSKVADTFMIVASRRREMSTKTRGVKLRML